MHKSCVHLSGSSPLARGLLRVRLPEDMRCGIIPARAGFTAGSPPSGSASGGSSPLARGLPTSKSSGVLSRGDHPRSRGVYYGQICGGLGAVGSSPLARGLLKGRVVGNFTMRIIPARAGFTQAGPGPPTPTPDHPRSRGVYRPFHVKHASAYGSSPLARGLPRARRSTNCTCRIIPARAGFTGHIPCIQVRSGDHPRSRGVYHADRF